MRLLDSDVVIDIQRDYRPARTWIESLPELPIVPGLVVMELIQDAKNNRQVREAQKIVSLLTVVWPTALDGERALKDFKAFHLSHHLGLLDALIAATALGLDAYPRYFQY